jgi:hypothetical protein
MRGKRSFIVMQLFDLVKNTQNKKWLQTLKITYDLLYHYAPLKKITKRVKPHFHGPKTI